MESRTTDSTNGGAPLAASSCKTGYGVLLVLHYRVIYRRRTKATGFSSIQTCMCAFKPEPRPWNFDLEWKPRNIDEGRKLRNSDEGRKLFVLSTKDESNPALVNSDVSAIWSGPTLRVIDEDESFAISTKDTDERRGHPALVSSEVYMLSNQSLCFAISTKARKLRNVDEGPKAIRL